MMKVMRSDVTLPAHQDHHHQCYLLLALPYSSLRIGRVRVGMVWDDRRPREDTATGGCIRRAAVLPVTRPRSPFRVRLSGEISNAIHPIEIRQAVGGPGASPSRPHVASPTRRAGRMRRGENFPYSGQGRPSAAGHSPGPVRSSLRSGRPAPAAADDEGPMTEEEVPKATRP
jgi:hypothetical protein